jgi:putative nucleotidyltransferase with HDIG domain
MTTTNSLNAEENVERILRQMGQLPTSLEVVCRLMLMLRNPTQENEQVVKALFSDQQLSVQLVRKLDSAEEVAVDEKGNRIQRQRPENEVLDILSAAVLEMGYTAILRLVSALSVGKLLAEEQEGYGMERRQLWMHSVVVGLIAQRLSELLADTGRSSFDPSIAFIAGLMHDIGKVALSDDLNTRTDDVKVAALASDANWNSIETTFCGVDHAELGCKLTEEWKLPPEICQAIRFHHKPSEGPKLAALIHLADYASRFLVNGGGWSSYAISVEQSSLAACGLKIEDIQRVVLRLCQDQESINSYASM